MERAEVGQKRKFEGSSKYNKKNRFLKSDSNNKRSGDSNEEK